MKEYLINICIFCLLTTICFAQQKNKLRYDGIYYWDNGKDTIIKNYELYQQAKDNFIFNDLNIQMQDSDFFVMGDKSRHIDLYRFYDDETYLPAFINEFNIERMKKIIDINRADDIKMGIRRLYALKGGQVYFEEKILTFPKGADTGEKKIINSGIIMGDSIIFKITCSGCPPGHKKPFGLDKDSIKVYHFLKFK